MPPQRQGPVTRIAVAIVSEHRLFAEGLEKVLAAEPSFSVTANGSPESRQSAAVIVLDGAEEGALGRCADLARDARRPVILVGAEPDDEWALAALRSGARGILLKDAGVDQLVKAVHVVCDGQIWAPNQAVARALGLLFSLSDPHAPRGSGPAVLLTPREKEIVRHTLRGLSNKEIADRMAITQATVKAHLTSVFRKLSVRDRIQLVVLYHAQPALASGRKQIRSALRA